MSDGSAEVRGVTDRALTVAVLLVGDVAVGLAAKVWLKRSRGAVINQ